MDLYADLRLFRYALAVAREGGFSRAAEALGISQAPLSQQIRKLEIQLGVRLFDRHHAGATPTGAGRLFLDRAAVALREADAALDAARRAGRGDAGMLTVGMTGGTMFAYLPPLLKAFASARPDVGLALRNLDPDAQVGALVSGQLDVGFTRMVAHPPTVRLRRVFTEAFVAALPLTHARASARFIALADLAHDPFVLFPASPSGFHAEVVALCRMAGFVPTVAQQIAPMHAVIGLVGAGLGVSVVPASVRVLQVPGVRYVALGGLSRASHLYMATLPGRQSPTAAALDLFVTRRMRPRVKAIEV